MLPKLWLIEAEGRSIRHALSGPKHLLGIPACVPQYPVFAESLITPFSPPLFVSCFGLVRIRYRSKDAHTVIELASEGKPAHHASLDPATALVSEAGMSSRILILQKALSCCVRGSISDFSHIGRLVLYWKVKAAADENLFQWREGNICERGGHIFLLFTRSARGVRVRSNTRNRFQTTLR